VVSRPPLYAISTYTLLQRANVTCVPGGSLSVDGREWNTATVNLEVRLVGLVDLTRGAARYGLGEALNLVMVDNRAGKHRRGLSKEGKESKQCQHFLDRCVLFRLSLRSGQSLRSLSGGLYTASSDGVVPDDHRSFAEPRSSARYERCATNLIDAWCMEILARAVMIVHLSHSSGIFMAACHFGEWSLFVISRPHGSVEES